MRRWLATVLVSVLAVVAFSSTATGSAPSGTKFFFDGQTQQGQELFFIIEDIGGVKNFEPFFTNFQINCPDGTSFSFGWFFLNWFIPLDPNGNFSMDLPSTQIPFHWEGTLTGKATSGIQSQGYASYDVNGSVQDCATGDVGWRATGVGSKATARPGADYTVTVERLANGKVRQTISVG